MRLTFHAIADPADGSAWLRMVQTLWPAYKRWYAGESLLNRPTYRDCRVALLKYRPEFVPEWERLVERAGGDQPSGRQPNCRPMPG